MRSLEKGQDKIQKICDKLRRNTLEPAEEEALRILEEAREEASRLKAEAELQAEQLVKQARALIEQERNVFHSALQQAAKQAVEALRQEIEHRLFNEELQHVLEAETGTPRVVARLINALVEAVEKEGLSTDLTAVIPRSVSAEEVNVLLLENVRKRLQKSPQEGHFSGGVQLKLHGKKMTVDLTDQSVRELLARYMRKDFRKFIFA